MEFRVFPAYQMVPAKHTTNKRIITITDLVINTQKNNDGWTTNIMIETHKHSSNAANQTLP